MKGGLRLILRAVAQIIGVAVVGGSLVAVGILLRNDSLAWSSDARNRLIKVAQTVASCGNQIDIDSTRTKILIVYLAIEEQMRPRFVREAEFAIASLGHSAGLNLVQTIGLGQISLKNFGRFYPDIAPAEPVQLHRDWIEAMRDDCSNLTVLVRVLESAQIRCTDEAACIERSICLLHAGSWRRCREAGRFVAYRVLARQYYALLAD